jgi:diaminopimelate decarboxylase
MKKIAGNPYIKKKDNDILLDSVLLSEILKEFNTPIMIFLENRIRDNIVSFRKIFEKHFKKASFYYSFKANYLPELCSIISSEGIGAELISLPELHLALKIGFPGKKIIVGGPYLSNKLIEKSVKNDIQELIIYNLNDLIKVNSIAKYYEKIQSICLRINSEKYHSKLGIRLDQKNIIKLKDLLGKCKNIKLTTILSHFTTQMNNPAQYKSNINSLTASINNLAKENVYIENINIGGGFPEASVMPESQLEKIVCEIHSSLTNLDINYERIYVEPGRYIVGDAGLFLTKIINIEEDRWIFLDIGNHVCPKFAKCSLRFYNTSQINQPHKFKTSLAGIIPTDQDVLAKDYFFTEDLNEGDVVLVANVGAYTLTFSNRFPYELPPILLIKNINMKKIFDPAIDHDISLF